MFVAISSKKEQICSVSLHVFVISYNLLLSTVSFSQDEAWVFVYIPTHPVYVHSSVATL